MTARFGPETSDDVLLEHARAGDRAALEALVLRHQARVYRFGMKIARRSRRRSS